MRKKCWMRGGSYFGTDGMKDLLQHVQRAEIAWNRLQGVDLYVTVPEKCFKHVFTKLSLLHIMF